MRKKKEIITDYRKKMRELNDQVIRTRAHYLNLIKKELVYLMVKSNVSE